MVRRQEQNSVKAKITRRPLGPRAKPKKSGRTSMRFLKTALAAAAATAMLAGPVLAQGKPTEIKIGITTFLSGPASVFGAPAKAAAEMIEADIDKKSGTSDA